MSRREEAMNDKKMSLEAEKPLESWKEIAVHLQRDVRTVARWEHSERLPVRRHHHGRGSSVYAYPSELDAWRAAREPQSHAREPRPTLWRRAAPALGVAAMLVVGIAIVTQGPILNPPDPLAEAADGKLTTRRLYAGPEFDFLGTVSPDGKLLSYTDWRTGDLAVVDLESKSLKRLTHDGSVEEPHQMAIASVFSRDGSRIAYSWVMGSFVQARIVSVEGSDETQILVDNEELNCHPMDWSADGKTIALSIERKGGPQQIAVVSSVDGSFRVLKTLDTRGGWASKLSHDGRYLVYSQAAKGVTGRGDIFLLATDGSREVQLTSHPGEDFSPVWAPGGDGIVFLSDRSGAVSLWHLGVTDGQPVGQPELLVRDIQSPQLFGFGDQRTLRYGLIAKTGGIYRAGLDGAAGRLTTAPEPLSAGLEGAVYGRAAWSPDGKKIAYLTRSLGFNIAELHVRSVENAERQVHPVEVFVGPNSEVSWTRSGDSVVFKGRRSGGKRTSVYRLHLSSGSLSTLFHAPAPFWEIAPQVPSEDGRTVYTAIPDYETASFRIFAHRLEGKQERELYASPKRQGTFHPPLEVSPGGKEVIFVEGTQLKRISTETGKVTGAIGFERLAPQGVVTGLAWAPDGRSIHFTLRPGYGAEDKVTSWHRYLIEENRLEKIDYEGEDLQGLTFHPDGKTVAFSEGAFEAELWEMENFLPEPRATD